MDKNIKYYWCRTRVRGSKKLKQSEAFEETAEAKGTGEFKLSACSAGPMAVGLGLETGAMVERQKSEAPHKSSTRGFLFVFAYTRRHIKPCIDVR